MTGLPTCVVERSRGFAGQLRSIGNGDTQVPNLDWTVTELGRHVAGLPWFWNQRNADGDTFSRPTDFGAYSRAMQDNIVESTPTDLADRVETEYATFVDHLRESDGQRWLYARRVTVEQMLGLAINELVLHGRDLAAVTGIEAPTYRSAEALAAVDAMMVTSPAFVDEAKAAAQPDGVYHVRFRGGPSYTWTKTGPTLAITNGKPTQADAHLVADPATFLLASLGRISQIRAGLSGKMISYGRKPWRFLGLSDIVIDGV